ncbi:hypothetical protein C0993_012499, partial [Termitomyces sp. T159_Od127]
FAATTIPVGDQAATAISYENWKEAVICLYPGAEESTRYTVNKLHQLVQDNFDLSAYTLGTFSTYYRKFQKIPWWLLQHGKIHVNKERCLFQQGIPTSLWAKIARQLEILKPTHHSEDPYDVKDVYEAGNWHLKGTDMSLGIPHAKGILLVPTQPQAANNTVITDSYIKKEDMEAAISAADELGMVQTARSSSLLAPTSPTIWSSSPTKKESMNGIGATLAMLPQVPLAATPTPIQINMSNNS